MTDTHDQHEEHIEKMVQTFHVDTIRSLLHARVTVIATTFTNVLVGLTVVATFGERIIPASSLVSVKFLLAFLLLLIPTAITDGLYKIDRGIRAAEKRLDDLTASDGHEAIMDTKRKLLGKTYGFSIWIYVVAMWVICLFVCGLIVGPHILALAD